VRELIQLLENADARVPLDVAALQIARLEFPDLNPKPWLALLDSHAAELGRRVPKSANGEKFVRIAENYLFDEMAFHGNQDDYYNARNSCLNEVLASRTGIPITLSVVYIEIARRLNRPVWGVGLPGHFVVRYQDRDFAAYLDPFHRGRILTAAECLDLAAQAGGGEPPGPAALAPVTPRQIALRMLHNLLAVYFRTQEHAKAIEVLNLLIAANPVSAAEHRMRGTLQIEAHRYRSAVQDLQRYLHLAPRAADRQEIAERITQLRGWLSTLN
jgi:regulator of sirC expression with transglutaminase-like and TPR domain